jgi:hypothetical protein
MLKTPPSLSALALAAFLAGCAGGGRGPPPGFEAGPAGMNLFISPSGQPFRAAPGAPYPSAVWFAGADADHDGRLTVQEFRADALAFFNSLDKNHDGVVDGFETQDYERSIPEMAPRVRSLQFGEGMNMNLGRRGGGGGGGGQGGGGGGRRSGRGAVGGREGAALFSYFFDPQPVAAADSDFNSRISLTEAQSIADRRFAMLDTAGAGFLTLATLPKTPVQTAAEARAKQRAKDGRRNGGPSGVEPPSGRRRSPSPRPDDNGPA